MTELVPLRSLVASYIGGGWGNDEMDYTHPEPAFVIRGTDLADAEYGTVGSVPYRFHKTSNLVSRRLEANEIVMEVSGGSFDQPVGRVMFVDEHVLGALDGPVMCASFCKRVVPDAEAVHPSYLYWYLQAVYTSGLIERYQVQSTGIRNLQFEYLLDDLPVHLPSRHDQEQTAAVLDTILELLRSNSRRIEILAEMARLIYREWFVQFRFPGHEDVELVDSDLGPVPEGWDARPIGHVIETVGGGTPSKEKPEYWIEPSINWYTPSDLTRRRAMFAFGSGDQINELGLSKSSAKLFPPRTVMITSRATIGEIAIATTEASTNQGFISCVPNERLSEHHLYFWLQENVNLFHTLAGGATFKELRKSTFRDLPIVLPPIRLEAEFNQAVGPMCSLIENLLRQNELLRDTRDLLLPRLISGEVDVSSVDLDLEPVA